MNACLSRPLQPAAEERRSFADGAKLLAAGLAAAVLVAGAPAADAKVVLKQPDVKNLVTGAGYSSSSSAASSSAAAAPKVEAPRAPPPAAMTSSDADYKGLVLPLSLVVVAGGGFAWYSLDPGFAEMMVEGGSKDSRFFAGYEVGLKDTPFFGGSGEVPKASPLGGKVAPKKKGSVFGTFGTKATKGKK
jgi:hypothetical protein